jgi:hypothetical protein
LTPRNTATPKTPIHDKMANIRRTECKPGQISSEKPVERTSQLIQGTVVSGVTAMLELVRQLKATPKILLLSCTSSIAYIRS